MGLIGKTENRIGYQIREPVSIFRENRKPNAKRGKSTNDNEQRNRKTEKPIQKTAKTAKPKILVLTKH